MSATAQAAVIKGIDVTTYLVKEPKRAIAFWRDIMGLPIQYESDQGAEFELADGSTFGLWRMDDGSWHPGHGVMFHVDDAKAAADLFRSRGAQIEEQIEESGPCYMAFGEDTEGNRFILHQLKR